MLLDYLFSFFYCICSFDLQHSGVSIREAQHQMGQYLHVRHRFLLQMGSSEKQKTIYVNTEGPLLSHSMLFALFVAFSC